VGKTSHNVGQQKTQFYFLSSFFWSQVDHIISSLASRWNGPKSCYCGRRKIGGRQAKKSHILFSPPCYRDFVMLLFLTQLFLSQRWSVWIGTSQIVENVRGWGWYQKINSKEKIKRRSCPSGVILSVSFGMFRAQHRRPEAPRRGTDTTYRPFLFSRLWVKKKMKSVSYPLLMDNVGLHTLRKISSDVEMCRSTPPQLCLHQTQALRVTDETISRFFFLNFSRNFFVLF